VRAVTYVWYIENSKQKILVDAGVRAEHFIARGAIQEDIQPLEKGMQKVGIKPEDIDIVILTHLHYDHIALAPLFTKAKFIVQKKELDAALNPHQFIASQFEKSLFGKLNIEVVDGDTEIIKGVSVMLTPGHTPGTQSIVVDTPKGKAIIAGFCCTLDTFNPPPKITRKEGLQVLAPGVIIDLLQAYDSALRVKQSADTVIALHDIEYLNKEIVP
jgi:glyoxylase-like metal-dependent hydrolase (beta-lactamase superfamily II)